MNYFVTAIDTDSGKTLVSAILCEALGADYWKPVQAGYPTDSLMVKSLVSNDRTVVHKESFALRTPSSPHASAKVEGIKIKLTDFRLPETSRDLVIEGAGGCLVPLNDSDFVIDLASFFKSEVILVADLYLGSINHTLLTFNELHMRNIPIKGIIFNGESNPESEKIILHHTNLRPLIHIERHENITKDTVRKYAQLLLRNWHG